MIEFCVIKPGDKVRRARAAGRQTHAEFASEFCMGHRHEGRHFLMPDLDELNGIFCALQCPEHAVDAVARIAINAPHAPLLKTADKKIADLHKFLRGRADEDISHPVTANGVPRRWFPQGGTSWELLG